MYFEVLGSHKYLILTFVKSFKYAECIIEFVKTYHKNLVILLEKSFVMPIRVLLFLTETHDQAKVISQVSSKCNSVHIGLQNVIPQCNASCGGVCLSFIPAHWITAWFLLVIWALSNSQPSCWTEITQFFCLVLYCPPKFYKNAVAELKELSHHFTFLCRWYIIISSYKSY